MIKKKTRIIILILAIVGIIVSIMTLKYIRVINPLDVMDKILFQEDISQIKNPERGWFRIFKSDEMNGIEKLKAQKISIVLLEADLKEFVTVPISEEKLDEISDAFTSARNNDLQVIFRAAYDFDGLPSSEPKSLDIIKGHITQLKSILYRNEDILYCVQAGFLGPWGEWHSSFYGDPPSLTAMKTVLFELMDAVPKTRAVLVRRPVFIREIYKGEPGGNIIAETSAYDGSDLSRTGYFNDALLSTDDEYGTYSDMEYSRQDELEWADIHTKFTPFVGETNYLGANNNPENAVYELNKLHAQSINIDYLPEVITKWKTTAYNDINTYDYISNRLGYRFILSEMKISSQVIKGGVLHVVLNMKNEGFGNLINRREFEMILKNGPVIYSAKVSDDPRMWFRENGMMKKDLYFSVPSKISSGKWSVYLNLPSMYPSLRENPEYSIRFANTGLWDEVNGYNLLTNDIIIDDRFYAKNISAFKEISRDEAIFLLKARYH